MLENNRKQRIESSFKAMLAEHKAGAPEESFVRPIRVVARVRHQLQVESQVLAIGEKWREGSEAACPRRGAITDEPEGIGGDGEYSSPLELLVCAAAHCALAALVTYAAFGGIELENPEIEVIGYSDRRSVLSGEGIPPPGLRRLEYKFRYETTSPAAKVARVVQKTIEHCPVLGTIRRTVPVTEMT